MVQQESSLRSRIPWTNFEQGTGIGQLDKVTNRAHTGTSQ